MELRFKIDGGIKDSLTWDDLEILEGGKIGASKKILARFMVNDADETIPPVEAEKILGALKMGEIEEVMQKFSTAISDGAINPQNAAS